MDILTDEYYTSPEFINEVMDYLKNMYPHKKFIWEANLPEGLIFKQGGDYKNYNYSTIPEGSVIVFNPPFSKIKEICLFMKENNINFVSLRGCGAFILKDIEVKHWFRFFSVHINKWKNNNKWLTTEGLIEKNIGIALITNIDNKDYKNGNILNIRKSNCKGVYDEKGNFLGTLRTYLDNGETVFWKRVPLKTKLTSSIYRNYKKIKDI